MKVKIGAIAKIRRGASPRPIDDPKYFGGEVGWVRIADVSASRKYLRKTTQYVSKLGESLSVRVDKGDLIMSIAGTVGRPIIIDIPACIHDGFIQLYDFKNSDAEFLYYTLQFLEKKIQSFGQSGTQTNVNTEIVGNVEIFHPPLPEQRRIAEILGTVDAEIEQTEALLAKYQRLKTGLLAELLTHGLDAQGQRRSPQTHQYKTVEGLTVPVEWEVRRLGDIAAISSGVTLGKTYEGAGTVELPYLRVANVQDGYLDLSEITTIRLLKSQVDKFLLENGDVLMNEGGDFDKLGRGTVWRGEIKNCIHQNHVFKVRSNRKKLLPDYLAYVSGSAYGKTFFVLNSKQSTNLASINSTQLKSFPIPLPSVKEQAKLIDSLDLQNETIGSEKQRLQKLHALKKGLMQELLSEPEAENAG